MLNIKNHLEAFECLQCGSCCRGHGDVRLRDGEIAGIAEHLSMQVHEFTAKYTRLSSGRRSLSLVDKNDACIFLGADSRCMIEKVKPDQCRTFPVNWSYPGWQEECRGVMKMKKEI